MSTTIVRGCVRSLPSCSRHFSKTTCTAARSNQSSSLPPPVQGQDPKQYPSHTTLPPAKMRALVSLYHQSENFITPENLSDAIDAAFIDKSTRFRSDRELKYGQVLGMLGARRRAQKVSWDQTAGRQARSAIDEEGSDAVLWSSQELKRSAQVKAALLGTESGTRPGLEALEDEYERVMEEIKEERERRS
ncbi:hypothetical protein NM688_g7585 [Phlebia brevispora]|uniref:Uncharacterized protein n=1 Tax=Phlebia brevispora TaxID=194682 RepID=A0ACC1S3L8_9APHY|nr:hypothetical protein NM688_g7585 [Phlebia brevispora]